MATVRGDHGGVNHPNPSECQMDKQAKRRTMTCPRSQRQPTAAGIYSMSPDFQVSAFHGTRLPVSKRYGFTAVVDLEIALCTVFSLLRFQAEFLLKL